MCDIYNILDPIILQHLVLSQIIHHICFRLGGLLLGGFCLERPHVFQGWQHLSCGPLSQDFGGAIIAITHNRAFAERLNATHILRVQVSPSKRHQLYNVLQY